MTRPVKSRPVLIMVHARRAEAAAVAARFARDVRAAGMTPRILASDADDFAAAGLDDVDVVEPSTSASAGCEIAVVFGGDGTILFAAEMCRDDATPILGVNFGHVGFLAEVDTDDVHTITRRVVDRDYAVEERLTIDVDVSVGGQLVATNWALNEASVEKSARERMLEVVVEIDNRPVSRWGGDGVVCATPTGSTAYNFSAGGPVVWPDVPALLVVPISAHALFARPMVVSPESTVAVEIVGERSTGVLWCDGRRASDLPLGARVVVRRGRRTVRLARLNPAPFADRLVRKFDLPVAGWRGPRRENGGGS